MESQKVVEPSNGHDSLITRHLCGVRKITPAACLRRESPFVHGILLRVRIVAACPSCVVAGIGCRLWVKVAKFYIRYMVQRDCTTRKHANRVEQVQSE